MAYRIVTGDRQAVLRRLESLAGEQAHYTGTPRFAYNLRGIVIERDGTVTTEPGADVQLVAALEREGMLEAHLTAAEDALENGTRGSEGMDEQVEPYRPSFSFPMDQHRVESICNLVFMVFSRGELLSKATGGTFKAEQGLADTLKAETPARIEEVLDTILEAGPSALMGLRIDESTVTFDGFPETENLEEINAWKELSAAMNSAAIRQHHIQARKPQGENEKFAFRTWLTRLGLNGPELKTERNLLYRNLSGHTAFRTPADEEKWKARQAAKRQEQHVDKAAASAENDAID